MNQTTFVDNLTSAPPVATFTTPTVQAQFISGVSDLVVYGLFIGLMILILFTYVLSRMIKNPKIKSKFARKSSFGTLQTVQT